MAQKFSPRGPQLAYQNHVRWFTATCSSSCRDMDTHTPTSKKRLLWSTLLQYIPLATGHSPVWSSYFDLVTSFKFVELPLFPSSPLFSHFNLKLSVCRPKISFGCHSSRCCPSLTEWQRLTLDLWSLNSCPHDLSTGIIGVPTVRDLLGQEGHRERDQVMWFNLDPIKSLCPEAPVKAEPNWT